MEGKKDVSSKIRHWCARAERSKALVRRKLRAWGALDQAEEVIATLVEEGYLDEARFAEAYALDHVRLKGWGPIKVASGLRYEHSIADADVERALSLLSEEDIRAAAAAAVVKRRRRHPEEPTNATVSDLLRRGFTVDVAKAAVAADVPPKFESPW